MVDIYLASVSVKVVDIYLAAAARQISATIHLHFGELLLIIMSFSLQEKQGLVRKIL